jgi:hypothetical protein
MPLAGFEPAIPATKRLQTYSLDCATTGIGCISCTSEKIYLKIQKPCEWSPQRAVSFILPTTNLNHTHVTGDCLNNSQSSKLQSY